MSHSSKFIRNRNFTLSVVCSTILSKMRRVDDNNLFGKIKRGSRFYTGYFALIIILLLFYVLYESFSLKTHDKYSNDKNEDRDSPLIKKIYEASKYSNAKLFSIWPDYHDFKDANLFDLETDKNIMTNVCLKEFIKNYGDLSIENFELIIDTWKSNNNEKCIHFWNKFQLIYELNFKKNKLFMGDELIKNVKSMLNNDDKLLEKMYKQELLCVYNRFTYEENVFNILRSKRPIKPPDIPPEIFYQKVMNESKDSCDFCKGNAAFSSYGKIETSFSYSGANLFPFDENHELFLTRKHDLTKLNYEEFKDILTLPFTWFKKVNKNNPKFRYPVLLWDFMSKGGASQMHPHLHGTVNENRYYGMFEILRNGAENYYKQTNRNYFSDFTSIHNMFGLTHIHKNAILIVPLTPKKDYDATIISQDFNDGVVELLYGLLKTYTDDMGIFPFSLTIHFPELDSNNKGRIPLYAKIIPRGDISSLRSDISTMELMTTYNVNLDQFLVIKKLKNSIISKIENL